MTKADKYDTQGRRRVTISSRPRGTNKVFTSVDDDTGVGDGANKLIFKLLSTDTNKKVNMTFSETVYLKDGKVIFKNAPLGATISAEARRVSDNVLLGVLLNAVQIYGTGEINFITEGRSDIRTNWKLQFVVQNSSGVAPEDAAADFEAVAHLGMFRSTIA